MRSAFLNIETGKQLIKLAQAEIEGKSAETEKLMALHAIKVNFEDMLKRERTVIILEPFVAEYVDGIRKLDEADKSKLPNSEDLLSQLRTLGARIMHRMLKVHLEAELKPWIEIQTRTLKSTNKMGNVPSWPIMDLQTVAGKLGRMYKT